MNNDALNFLVLCHDEINKSIPIQKRKQTAFVGKSPAKWFKGVNVKWTPNQLSAEMLNRYNLLDKRIELKSKDKLSKSDIRTFIIDILSWGASRQPRLSMLTIDSYEDICKDLLDDKISPIDAYDRFYNEHKVTQKMRGMGPAYYTKLVCFFCDQNNSQIDMERGIIMDQWTARSVNRLKNKEIIKMTPNKNGYSVSASNNKEIYSEFLSIVSDIKKILNISDILDAEELIFSTSYKKNQFKKIISNGDHQILSAWRRYIAEDIKINFDKVK